MKTGTDNPGANEAFVNPTFLKVCFVPHGINQLQVPVNTDELKHPNFSIFDSENL